MARVAEPVAVRVLLARVSHGRAVVHIATHPVSVDIVCRIERARVAGIAPRVPVGVLLARIRVARAVVHVAAHPVRIGIVRGVARARVACIAVRVPILVLLAGVGVGGAVVHVAADAVAVDVVGRVERARIADVSKTVGVRIGLVGIRPAVRTVVACVAHPVSVRVGLRRRAQAGGCMDRVHFGDGQRPGEDRDLVEIAREEAWVGGIRPPAQAERHVVVQRAGQSGGIE